MEQMISSGWWWWDGGSRGIIGDGGASAASASGDGGANASGSTSGKSGLVLRPTPVASSLLSFFFARGRRIPSSGGRSECRNRHPPHPKPTVYTLERFGTVEENEAGDNIFLFVFSLSIIQGDNKSSPSISRLRALWTLTSEKCRLKQIQKPSQIKNKKKVKAVSLLKNNEV